MGPLQISEIILHTTNYEAMKAWYQRLFGDLSGDLKPAVEESPQGSMKSFPEVLRLCFLRIHMQYPFTQVLGLFEVKTLKSGGGTGLNHMQFREASLDNLFERYETLKKAGILPPKTYNHGPATSFYYRDPDGNEVEISATNFPTEQEYVSYMKSEAFRKNPEGDRVDADAYIAQHRSRK
ncbi:MAG: VOC family protein [Candidatus Parcubacteria bacterium]|nr:VOC family protein [Burkholderiales bacterium]